MAAKVDNSLVQDGYQIYHHAFFFSRNGAWAVVQQGMNEADASARRYHWFSENARDLVCEPHTGIVAPARLEHTLNLTARDSAGTRELSIELVDAGYRPLMKDIEILRAHASPLSQMVSIRKEGEQLTFLHLENKEFTQHPVLQEDFSKSRYLEKILRLFCDARPKNYEQLIATEGVGPKTVRALSLVGEVIYGAKPSYEDPARYSFAHGGKDETPYPVDRPTYDQTIATLAEAVRHSHMNPNDKDGALKRLTASA